MNTIPDAAVHAALDVLPYQAADYVDMDFIQFLAVEGDRVRCWYMNSGGDGPTFAIDLHRASSGWVMTLQEHPPGTEQDIEVP